MTRKDDLLSILDQSRQIREQYIAGLSDEQKAEKGSYEEWAPKDMLAHVGHWVQHQAARLEASPDIVVMNGSSIASAISRVTVLPEKPIHGCWYLPFSMRLSILLRAEFGTV